MSETPQINLGVEQFLAAILNKVGEVEITQDELFGDYSQYAVSVQPTHDSKIVISLADLQGVDLDDIAE